MIGWCGYPINNSDIVQTINSLSPTEDTYGMWIRSSEFESKTWTQDSDFSLIDVAVAECERCGKNLNLDFYHNAPPSAYITSAKKASWISKSILIGLRYKDHPCVILHPVNEYNGTGQVTLANDWFKAVRGAGIHLRVAFSLWWNQNTVTLSDPDNNYSIVRHLYGHKSTSNVSYPLQLDEAIKVFGIDVILQKYFYSTTETMYLQSIIQKQIPLGFFVTELGPTDDEVYVSNPSVADMAFCMGVIRECIKNKVSFLLYRIGEYSKKSTYEDLALKYFNEPLIPILTPPTPVYVTKEEFNKMNTLVTNLTNQVDDLKQLVDPLVAQLNTVKQSMTDLTSRVVVVEQYIDRLEKWLASLVHKT